MFRRGLVSSLPITVGYFPVAITFGLSATALGFSRVDTLLASMLIFAGASQFALVSLISYPLDAVLIPVFLNLRHIVYSCIISQKFEIKRPYITAFGLTDEVFATSLNSPENEKFIWGLETGAYLSWVSGTLVGVLGGTVLLSEKILTPSLVFALTALFLVLLIPNFKGYHALSALTGGAVALVFQCLGHTSTGILLAGILSPIVVLKIKNRDKKVV